MSVKRASSESDPTAKKVETSGEGDLSKLNTMYLDRFIQATSVAPKLIEMRIFPNVKEITESMAAYAHVSRNILTVMHDDPPQDVRKDVILCVGDGSTPRSAAMFALFHPDWECYSIDPQLQEGFIKTHKNEAKLKKHDTDAMRQERRALWHSVPNLHIVGECIQNVRIRCRHLVLVMIHCHLSFQQVMSSVDCEDIAGVLTLPCCNYFAIQQQFMTQMPTMEFKDPGIWSEKNTVRLWVQPSVVWGEDYSSMPDEACVLPLPIPCTRLLSALELKDEILGKEVETAGEVIAVRKFGKKLTFVFLNTSNVYYTAKDDSYAYYDTDSYDDNNACRNACVVVMKLEFSDNPEETYQQLFGVVSKLKNRRYHSYLSSVGSVIHVSGTIVKSKKGNNIISIHDLSVLATNKQVMNAQWIIGGIDVDYLNISCKNERNINFVNRTK